MRHALDAALDELEELLREIRLLEGLTERTRGTFYRKSIAFLHFHEDPAGLFADLKGPEGWTRMRVNNASERQALLEAAKEALAQSPPAPRTRAARK